MMRLVAQTFLIAVVTVVAIVIVHESAQDTNNYFTSGYQEVTAQLATWGEVLASGTERVVSDETYHILALGDIMLDRGVEARVMGPGAGDWNFPFALVSNTLAEADVVFANLESAVSDRGVDSGKKYSFRIPPTAVSAVAVAGIDVVSIANNHTLDWGYDALCDTATHVREAGILPVGAGCDETTARAPAVVILADGTEVAFLAFTEFYEGADARGNHAGLAHYDLGAMQEAIGHAREQGAEVVMVSLHWGIEYETRSSTAQQELARELLAAGADVIIGHHPHVPQEIERTEQGWVIYSLGNFIFDQDWSEPTMRGLVADIQIQDGQIRDIVPYPVHLNENFQPAFTKAVVFDK